MIARPHVRCRAAVVLAALVTLVLLPPAPPAAAQRVVQTNLVSDISGMALHTDPNLVNPWGMSFSPSGSPFWVSNQGTGNSTLYSVTYPNGNPHVAQLGLKVTIPHTKGGTQGMPTGQVFNGTGDFVVSQGGGSGPARFIFAGLDGTISGWNPGVPPPPPSTQATIGVDNGVAGAAYTGITLANNGSGNFLYAANAASGKIDVFDSTFTPAAGFSFADASLPAGASPFNIRNIGGNIYVAYTDNAGGGAVDVFTPNGVLIRRIATDGVLSNPWGMAIAPSSFGKFAGDLLVGNFNGGDPAFGNGWIDAFDPNQTNGPSLGLLTDPMGSPVSINGLWSLAFGNDGLAGRSDILYFTAGIDGTNHGLFGSLQVTPEAGSLTLFVPALIPAALLLRRRKAEGVKG